MFRIDRNVEDKSRKAKLIDSEVSSCFFGGMDRYPRSKVLGQHGVRPSLHTGVDTWGRF
jgi:hypothetical protein